ncbi:ATP-dependent nuclease [Nostoc sp. ChiSLP03a]|uniref:ATP-dependent nuclease n=1 Tax=Nostoc sp. ChiSLP03a TaxID=3075380 RepID=UPI002AD321EF|nr:AAA family ATPase [Nostoc sp. ChiSLP03a]MDZ8215660.1 AAA family ATPase [Nostoc sp. ChiSLP03a]
MPGTKLSRTEFKLIQQWNNPKAFPDPRLSSMEISGVSGVRGIKNFSLNLDRPITAICGKAGVGKSTLISLLRLAFKNTHSVSTGQSNFDDLFLTTHIDTAFTEFGVKWNYIKQKPEKEIPDEVNFDGITKSFSVNPPNKKIIFISTFRSILGLNHVSIANHFKTNPLFDKTFNLNEKFRQRLSDTLGKSFSEAALNITDDLKVRSCLSGNLYSSLNMSSGEDVLIELFYVLQMAEAQSLILIEDIESGLYPSAITKLTPHIIEICLEKKFQIIVTTRSIDFIDALPREFRCLIEFNNFYHQIYDCVPKNKVISSISSSFEPDIIIFCEDSVAETLIRLAVPGDIRRRLKIVCGGTKAKLASLAEAHIISGWRQRVLIVWDGDVKPKEITDWMKSLNMSDEDKNTKINRIKLPGTVPPEQWIVEILFCPEGLQLLASELREDETYAEFLLSTMKTLFKHHNVFRETAQLTQLDERTVANVLVKAVDRLSSNPLAILRNQLERIANGEQVIEVET